MRTSDPISYTNELYREHIDKLLEEVKEEFLEEYQIFLKIRSDYIKTRAANLTIHTRLTRVCRDA